MAKMPPLEQLKGRTLGRILIKMGILTREKVQQCLEVQKKEPGKHFPYQSIPKNAPVAEHAS